MVSDSIGPFNAIGKVAAEGVRIALEAGYRVTAVANRLDESLQGEVEWLKLYVPRRGFAIQWLTGRHWIKKAIGNRKFDVVHVHQPQAADLADVYQCHFLTRVAYERGCLFDHWGIRGAIDRMQKWIVLQAEDYFYRRWNDDTRMLFDSELTRQEFIRLYRSPPLERTLPYAFPDLDLVTDTDRVEAKLRWIGRVPDERVIGYLGGVQVRKGYKRIFDAMRKESGLFLLMGGSFTTDTEVAEFEGRAKSVGMVQDTRSFYAACDAFMVPSLFEPLGLVAFEAAARGVPVIATAEVGALPHLQEFGTGLKWSPAEALLPIVKRAVDDRANFQAGAAKMAAALGVASYAKALLEEYAAVIYRRNQMMIPEKALV